MDRLSMQSFIASQKKRKRQKHSDDNKNIKKIKKSNEIRRLFLPDYTKQTSDFFTVPSPVIQNNILIYLNFETKKTLRLVCKKLLEIVSSVWKPWITTNDVNEFIIFSLTTNLQSWPTKLYGLKFLDDDYNSFETTKDFFFMHTSLKALNFKKAKKIYFDTIPSSIESITLPKLKDLNVCLEKLPSTILNLSLFHCEKVNSKTFENLPKYLESLELISCHEFIFTKSDLEKLPLTLKKLNLQESGCLTGEMLKYIPSSITDLNLNSCIEINRKEFTSFPPNLTSLNLSSTAFSTTSLKFLPSTITTLELNDCKVKEKDLLDLPVNLTRLDLAGTTITVNVFKYLRSNLRYLCIGACAYIEEIPLRHIAEKFPDLIINTVLPDDFEPNVFFKDECKTMDYIPSYIDYIE